MFLGLFFFVFVINNDRKTCVNNRGNYQFFFVDDRKCIVNGENSLQSNNAVKVTWYTELNVLEEFIRARMRNSQW